MFIRRRVVAPPPATVPASTADPDGSVPLPEDAGTTQGGVGESGPAANEVAEVAVEPVDRITVLKVNMRGAGEFQIDTSLWLA